MMEEKESIKSDITDENVSPSKKKRPLGILILGMINLVILGAGFFILFLLAYLFLTQETWESFTFLLQERNIFVPSIEEFKHSLVFHMGIAIIFIVTGTGILLRKEWARMAALYLAFFLAIIIAFSVVVNPKMILQAAIQLVYPGIMIYYFTQKGIKMDFKK